MKIALTGHTFGIGKYIYDNYPNVQGFSRTNGYDINLAECRKNIIDKISDTDVLINSAHSGFSQSYLLLDFFLQYRWQDKKIINIGSTCTDGYFSEDFFNFLDYRMQKRSLKDLSTDLTNYKCNIDIIYINMGYVFVRRPNISQPLYNKFLSVAESAEIIMEKAYE